MDADIGLRENADADADIGLWENADADADADVEFNADFPRMRMRMRISHTSLTHTNPLTSSLHYSTTYSVFSGRAC